MNAKHVLNKIIAALSADKPVEMTYAKLADGTILESPTFDVGEDVEVVSEDGAKTAAPDGEHELILKDTEGNDVRIKVITKDGVITERENVELQSEEEVAKEEAIEDMVAGLIDTLTPDEVSSEVAEDIAEKVLEALEDKIEILKKRKATKMESEEEAIEDMVAGLIDTLTPDEVSSVIAEDIAEKVLDALEDKIEILKKRKSTKMASIAGEDIGGEEDEDMEKKYADLAYRIEEMEKKIAKMEEIKEDIKEDMEDEEELPKLDGAPVEENASKTQNIKMSKKDKVVSSQSNFLSKLYK